MKNEMWKTVGISVLTSVIVFFVLYFLFGSVIQLGPSVSPTKEINANRCQADGVCEVNSLTANSIEAGNVFAKEELRTTSLRTNDLYSNGDVLIEGPHGGDLQVTGLTTFGNGESGGMNPGSVRIHGDLQIYSLNGTGTSYLCVQGSQGRVYRSQTPCV